MKPLLFLLACLLCTTAWSQDMEALSPFNGRYWGVVMGHPDTEKITVLKDIEYGKLDRPLHLDVYLPVDIDPNEKRPTVVILNGLGDHPGQPEMKNSPSHTSWARLLAAYGIVAVTMQCHSDRIQESFQALFNYLGKSGASLHVDANNMGAQAFSANCRQVTRYIMSAEAWQGIRAASLYYGEDPTGVFREDLPVLFVVAEKDIRGKNYGGIWNNVMKTGAPWTITVARDMPHAFDFFSDTETSRRIVKSTISFWNDQLGPAPAASTPFSKEREIVAATYDEDPGRKIRLMGEWMKEHPESKDAFAFSTYGAALMDTQAFEESEKYLKKANAFAPKNSGNHLMLAVVSYCLGKNKEGDANLALYEKGTPPEAFTYFYIADRLRAVQKYEQAASLYERAMKFPDPPGFLYYNLGSTYAQLGKTDKAFENLLMAAEMGWSSKENYETDDALINLRGDKRWSDVLAKLSR